MGHVGRKREREREGPGRRRALNKSRSGGDPSQPWPTNQGNHKDEAFG